MNNTLTIIFVALQVGLAVICILQLIFKLWYWKASKEGHWYVEVLSEQGLNEYDLKSFMGWLGYATFCLARILCIIILCPIIMPAVLIGKIVDRVKETRDSEQE